VRARAGHEELATAQPPIQYIMGRIILMPMLTVLHYSRCRLVDEREEPLDDLELPGETGARLREARSRPRPSYTDWDDMAGVPGSTLEEPGRLADSSNNSAAPVLGDADILAAEALLDPRLLALILALGERPRQAGELAKNLRVLVVRRVRVRKKVKVRDPGAWGYREVVREVEEERAEPSPIPASTLYRLLARLRRAGLAEEYRGLDARRRYYRLTRLGREVYERVRGHLLEVLRGKSRSNTLPWETFEAVARSLRLDPQQLAEWLGLRIAGRGEERRVQLEAATS